MSAAPASRGLVALFKRGWNEIPEVVGSGFFFIGGLALVGLAVKTYYDKDGDNRRHKLQYTVIRHDDPRVAKVHKD